MSSRLCIVLFLYLKIISVTSKGNSSLTFVIDDTGSMKNEVAAVKRGIHDLLNFVLKTKSSEIEDLILVTFNDPDVRVRAKTKNETEFIQALESISVYGGSKCPESSMKGIIEALKKSRSNSYIYVFTDANARDYDRVKEVVKLCEQKQSQVIIVLTDKCRNHTYEGYYVYYKIAKACSGSIIEIGSHEVRLAVNMIRYIVDNKKTIVSWTPVPYNYSASPVSFTLDEKTEYAIITASGPGVQFDIRKSKNFGDPILPMEEIMWTTNFKVVKLINYYPGTYTAWVKGNGEVSIVVYGKTDFTFEHGFSNFVPKSLVDTTKQPIAGKDNFLSISVLDPQHEVNIRTVAILSNDKKALMEFPLWKIGTDFYVTDHFLPPDTMFKVAVKGFIVKTGKPIVRISKISVQPRFPDAKIIPSVTIKEGSKIEVNYGSNVSLTCEVSAYPKPKIQWYDSDSNLLESQSSMIQYPYKYTSKSKVNQLKRSKSFICKASNVLGLTNNIIQIKVIPPLKKIATFPAVTEAEYGKDLKLKCLIHSSWNSTQTKWYFKGPTDKLSLSADRSELTIKDMDIDLEGSYRCKVLLKDDPEIAEVQTTRVKIVDLAPPEVSFDFGRISVPEKSKKIISCRIVKGTPRPKINWQYKKNDGSELIDLNESSEDLTIYNVSLNRSGKYVCTATNDFGSATAVTELEVLKSPEIIKDGDSHAHVPYDSKLIFTCRVVANPSPTIIWKDKRGNSVHSIRVSVNEYEMISRLKLRNIRRSGAYSCYAKNSAGKSEQLYAVSVEPPIKNISILNVVKEVKFGEEIKLKCDLISNFSVERNWVVNMSNEFITSDDKYSLTRDAEELVIKSMDINFQGTYICIVKLKEDPDIFVEKNIALVIKDLAPPEVSFDSGRISVLEKSKKIISCRIVKGTPRPKINWQYKKNDGSELIDLNESSEDLTIYNVSLNRSGKYVCTATNDFGSATAVTELEVLKSPEIIKDGDSHAHVPYDSKLIFTCRVVAYPSPTIIWKDKRGNIVHSIRVSVNEYEMISRLKLRNIRRSGAYSCYAKNSAGKSEQLYAVSVEPPIKNISILNVVKEVKFGEEIKLKCDLTSNFSVERNWVVNMSKEFITSDDKYSLTRDAEELVIKSMDINLQGTYICIVKLKEDPDIFVEKNIALVIKDLAPPEVSFDSGRISVLEKSKKIISCRIVKGTPRPKINWQYKKNDGSELIDLNESSEDLTIYNVSLNRSGKYVCTATNDFGSATAVTELEVLKSPEIIKDGDSHAHVPYDSKLIFTCRVVAYPSPTIIWKDKRGNSVHSIRVSVNEHETISWLKLQNIRRPGAYSCNAENSAGKSEQLYVVSVEPPIKNNSKLNVVKAVKFGEEIKLKCDLTSNFSVERNWVVNMSKEFITSDDKYSLTWDAKELVIKSVDINLQGTYICNVKLKEDPDIFAEKNIALVIKDLAPPKLASSKEIWNKTFIARCAITKGVPRPVIKWKFKGNSGGFIDLGVEGETLTIKNIQPQHNGSYQCIGINAVGSDGVILSLELEESPKIVTEKTEYRGVVGDTFLVIPYNVTGYPDPKIVWKNTNNEIIEPGSKYIIKGSSSILSLYILNPIEKDTGKLICEAQNNVGNTAKTFDILVVSDVTDDGDLGDKHYVSLLENKSKDINCTTPGSDSQSIRWYKNGYLTNLTGMTYSMKKAKVSDDGSYTCRVNTDVGSVSGTFVVDVGYKPVFEDDETLVSWYGDENYVVNCTVRAKPAATVEWFIDGERTDNQEFEHHIHVWGKYKCKVSNIHGVVEKTVTVTTFGCLINRTMEENNNPPFILNTDINVDSDEPVLNYNNFMFIGQGQQMKLTCHKAGKNTFNIFPDTDTIIAECDTDDKFKIDGRTYKYSDLKCKEPLILTVKPTNKRCINADSNIIEIGFEVPNFVKVYEICWDNELSLPNYGHLKLFEHNLGNQEYKRIFKFPNDGVRGIGYCDAESKCCYEKGQFVNSADVDIGPPQITPFVDLYAIYVWKPCGKENRMTWRNLEEGVRSLLLTYSSIDVWSGATGYENVGVRKIPRYLWKVLKANQDIIGVIVYVNTPHPKTEDKKCKKPEHISEELSFVDDDAFTYLCTLEEFSNVFAIPMDTFSRK